MNKTPNKTPDKTPPSSSSHGHTNDGQTMGAPVWDVPLRLFHWALAIAVFVAIGSAKNGVMFVHEKAGLTVLGLVIFRIIWGFIGSHHARFSNFMTMPKAVWAYIQSRRRGDRTYHPGHAPTGAYATIAILMVLLAMASFGTMANDDILYEGPLAAYVGDFTNDARRIHHWIEKLVFLLIALHFLAIAVYRFKWGIKLIPPMIIGGRDETIKPISRGHQVFGLVLMAATVAASQSLGFLGDRFF